MAAKTRRYCVQLPEHLEEPIKQLATNNERSVSREVRRAVEAALKKAGIPVPKPSKN